MSFKVSNTNKNIVYYTVLLDRDQIVKDDSLRMEARQKPKPKKTYKRNIEQIVFDRGTGKWVSVQTVQDF